MAIKHVQKIMVKNEVKQFLRYLAEKILHSNSKTSIESIDIFIQTGQ